MTTFSHLWQYLAKFVLKWKHVLHKSFKENKNRNFMFNSCFSKIVPFMRYVEIYDGASGATTDVTIWRIWLACWINKVTCTHAHADAHSPKHKHAHMRSHTQVCIICQRACMHQKKLVVPWKWLIFKVGTFRRENNAYKYCTKSWYQNSVYIIYNCMDIYNIKFSIKTYFKYPYFDAVE
jgi:hypothetical protein